VHTTSPPCDLRGAKMKQLYQPWASLTILYHKLFLCHFIAQLRVRVVYMKHALDSTTSKHHSFLNVPKFNLKYDCFPSYSSLHYEKLKSAGGVKFWVCKIEINGLGDPLR
jgi:hypothetical protein